MKFDAAPAWWSQRPAREKLMLAGAALAALGALADALLTAPLARRLDRGQATVQTLQARWQAHEEQQRAHAEQDRLDAELRRQLHERLAAAQQRAQLQNQRIADTARLPETLRAIVATVGSARLVELELGNDGSAPPAAGAASTPSAGATAMTRPRRLYRLPITLKVSGTWAELQWLLAQIEHHADALQWSSLALDNGEWPAIALTLKAHVTSLQPRWGAAS